MEYNTMTILWLCSVCTFVYIVSIFFSTFSFLPQSILFASIAAFLGTIAIIKMEEQWFSLKIVFWIFSFIYAISMPLNFFAGVEIARDYAHVINLDNINFFMICYDLSSIFFMGGCLVCRLNKKQSFNIYQTRYSARILFEYIDASILTRCTYISALFASSFDIVNTIRAGGFQLLFTGNKGIYQSAVSNLSGTLPSEMAYAVFGMYAGLLIGLERKKNNNPKAKIMFSILLLSPFLMIHLILGMRGALVSAFLTGVACYAFVCPIKKISLKIWMFLFVGYCATVFLSSYRGAVPYLLTDINKFFDRISDTSLFLKNLNPCASEFGAAVGNFCTYFNKYGSSGELLFGESYIKGLAVLVPAFLYPGTKPIQITYLFRDEFFSFMANLSDIGSTGFSSILEAYMNFGIIGVGGIYFTIGLYISKLESINISKITITKVIAIASFVPLCMRFSRSALGGLISGYTYTIIVALLVYTLATGFKTRLIF